MNKTRINKARLGEEMPRLRLVSGKGTYKRVLGGCPEISDYPENSEELLPEDAGIDCDLCHIFGEALTSKLVREDPILRHQLSDFFTRTSPIEQDDLCSWTSCCDAMMKCQGCDHKPEYIVEWLEDAHEVLKRRRQKYRPPVVSASVGGSFGRGDES